MEIVVWGDPYESALLQLRQGSKTGHWMWYVLPQIQGLGSTDTARYFAIASIDEARAYLAHPVLGVRLRECVRAVLAINGRTAESVFGPTDTRKLRSSLTLFLRAAPGEPLFRQVADRFFGGEPDRGTLDILRRQASSAAEPPTADP